MKYSGILLITLIAIITILSACLKNVEFKMPGHKPTLVLNSVFNPDSTFTVDLSSSRDIFSNEKFVPVKNASVRIFRNGSYLAELPHAKNGIYTAPFKPESLQKYTITATAPGFPNITANNYVPVPPSVRQIQTKAAYARADDSYLGVNLSCILDAPSTEENFYFIRAYAFAKDYSGKTYVKDVGVSFLSPIEEDFSIGYTQFFTDKLFRGRATTLKLHLDITPTITTYLLVAHITKEYYSYSKTLVNFSFSDSNLNQQPVSNNIENGMGLFAGYNTITIPIKP